MEAAAFVQRKWKMPLTSTPNPTLVYAIQAYGPCSFPVATNYCHQFNVHPSYSYVSMKNVWFVYIDVFFYSFYLPFNSASYQYIFLFIQSPIVNI